MNIAKGRGGDLGIPAMHEKIAEEQVVERIGDRGRKPHAVQHTTDTEPVVTGSVEERLDSQMIPGGEDPPLTRVGDDEGEIAKQVIQTVFSPGVIGVENHFCVRGGRRDLGTTTMQLANQIWTGIDAGIG